MTSLIERIVNWLKGGYPQGIPESDYVPLFAVLRRRLGADEINELADRLVREGLLPARRIDVGSEFLRVTDELPSEAEIRRIVDELRESGVDVSYAPPPWISESGSE